MSDDNVHLLSNSFLAVRLIALHELPESAGLGAGPYLVVQRAIDPADPDLTVDDFVLTRRGAWLPIELFARLPRAAREATACFPAAAEVVALLEELPSRPVVERPPAPGGEAEAAGELTEGDRLDAALRRALLRETQAEPSASAEERRPPGFN